MLSFVTFSLNAEPAQFCDFGLFFNFLFYIQSQGNPGVVMCMDSRTHGLQTGQSVCFKEINGMIELNGATHQVTGINTNSTVIMHSDVLSTHIFNCVCVFSSVSIQFCD